MTRQTRELLLVLAFSFWFLLFLLVVSIVTVVTAGAQTVVPRANACAVTEGEFLKDKRHLVATPATLRAIEAEINRNLPVPLRADKLAISPLDANGVRMVGVVMFRDGCVLLGTVRVFPAEAWAAFLNNLGLGMDGFVSEVGI